MPNVSKRAREDTALLPETLATAGDKSPILHDRPWQIGQTGAGRGIAATIAAEPGIATCPNSYRVNCGLILLAAPRAICGLHMDE